MTARLNLYVTPELLARVKALPADVAASRVCARALAAVCTEHEGHAGAGHELGADPGGCEVCRRYLSGAAPWA